MIGTVQITTISISVASLFVAKGMSFVAANAACLCGGSSGGGWWCLHDCLVGYRRMGG